MNSPKTKKPAHLDSTKQPATLPDAEAPVNLVSDDDLSAIARTVFSNGDYGNITLRSGAVVTIQMCKARHIGKIQELLQFLINSLNSEQFSGLLDLVVNAQLEAITTGGSIRDVSIGNLINKTLGIETGQIPETAAVVGKGTAVMSAAVGLLGSAIEQIAKLTPAFCTLSEEEYLDLDLDEAALVVYAIFMANYAFFIQTLPRIFSACLAVWVTQQRKANPSLMGNLQAKFAEAATA